MYDQNNEKGKEMEELRGWVYIDVVRGASDLIDKTRIYRETNPTDFVRKTGRVGSRRGKVSAKS
jgi:hypothetical protein